MPNPDQQERSTRGSSGGGESERLLRLSTFDAHIGTEFLDLGPDEARARIPVADHHQQPFGLVHGGVMATLAESICSAATYTALSTDGMTVIGQANETTFLRPITEGHVNAIAHPRHRGRTTWVWDVELRDNDDRLCALARLTIAVRPVRQGD